MNNDKGNKFVEQMIRTYTWWKLKTHFEKELLGIEKKHGLDRKWEIK